MRTKLITEPVFDTFVRLVYDASIDEFCQCVKRKYNYKVGNHGEASMGKLVILGDSEQVLLWVKDNLMIEVVHETAHLVAHWMRYKGIPINESTDDVFAHLQCFYIDKIARTFDKKKRKKKEVNRCMEDKKLKRLKKWVENYLPDFWETRGKQFQYGWNYLKNDILVVIEELLKEKEKGKKKK